MTDPDHDLPGGLHDKAVGQQRAIDAVYEEWKIAFNLALYALARAMMPFTSEDVTDIVGLPHEVKMNKNNAVGALMSAAAKQGIIRPTGRRVKARRRSSHGADLAEWIGTGKSRDDREIDEVPGDPVAEMNGRGGVLTASEID